MKKLLLLPILALALFAGSAAAPKHASAICTGNTEQSALGAFIISDAPASVTCGGTACNFDLVVPWATTVYPCGRSNVSNWRYMRYSRGAGIACTTSGFVLGNQDGRCAEINGIQVIANNYTGNDPFLKHNGGSTNGIHVWGFVQG